MFNGFWSSQGLSESPVSDYKRDLLDNHIIRSHMTVVVSSTDSYVGYSCSEKQATRQAVKLQEQAVRL